MTTPSGHQVPVQATSGATYDTSEESPSIVPGFAHGAPISDPGEALHNSQAADLNRLNSFLMTSFPREMQRTNRAVPESPVDVAIRLLRGLGSTGTGVRCSQEYCNLPIDHDGDHGFINYETR
jgi:hypothetical protein